jgi:hypothetical protein
MKSDDKDTNAPRDPLDRFPVSQEQTRDVFNENHKRHLLLTFRHVDKILHDALHEWEISRELSPFQRYLPESSPANRQYIADSLVRLRKTMLAILHHHKIPLPEPSVNPVWGFRVALMSAKNAIVELRPKYMRGYGKLPPEAVHELEAIISELEHELQQMYQYLE